MGAIATIHVDGPVSPERVRAWNQAYVSSGIADSAWIPQEAVTFHGSIRRRQLQDLLLIEIEADPFGNRWDRGSPAAKYVGLTVTTRPFDERVVLADGREYLSRASVDVWDAGALLETEPLTPMAQTTVLVPKSALHMCGASSLVLHEVAEDPHRATLRVLRGVLLAVAAEAEQLSPVAAAAARDVIVDLLKTVICDGRLPSGGAVSESMRMSVTRWVDEHLYVGQISPSSAAEEHGISVRSLHRLFADTGESFGSLVRRRRLERACRDLMRTDDMVQSIAMRWGYADASQFIGEFKRAYGSTPATFRKSERVLAA